LSRRRRGRAASIALAAILVAACGESAPSIAPPSPSLILAPSTGPSAPAPATSGPTPSASAAADAELLPISGTWRVRKVLAAQDRSSLLGGRTFDEETYTVTAGCAKEPCDSIEVTTTPVGLTAPATSTELRRNGPTYTSKVGATETTDCKNVEGDRVAGGATSASKVTLWIAKDRASGTSVIQTVLKGQVALDVKPTSIGEAAGCEAEAATFDVSGRRESVAIRDPSGEPELPDLKPPKGAVFVSLPKINAPVPNATVRYFAISGDTSIELAISIARGGAKACGMIDYEWFRGDARPSACTLTYLTDVQDSIRLSSGGAGCKVARANVQARYVINMPRWVAPPRVPKRLLDWWRRIVAFIATHEAGHVRIGREYTKRLNARLLGKDCDQIDEIIQAWAKQHAAAQENYDRVEYTKPWPQPASGY
jgi:predicted secreted Zn-dependent protease